MYKDEIKKYSPLTIEDIIKTAKELLPPPYNRMPWSHPELNRGTGILKTEDGLNSYLAAYGLPHKLNVFHALSGINLSEFNAPIEVFDWGCGQGLASVCLIQYFSAKNILHNVKKITLVEPSEAALERATLNVKSAAESIKVVTINKGLPATVNLPFESIEAIAIEEPIAIHLFSNILDLHTLDLKKLAKLIASSGENHYVICNGPANRNEDRISAFCANFEPNKAMYFQYDNRNEEELTNRYSTPKILPYYRNTEFFTDRSYGRHTFGSFIKAFKFDLTSGEPVLVPYKFFAPKQFFAAYKSDLLDNINIEKVKEIDTAFEVLAPFDIGASVYDDIHPILAVLNNIIVRGLPTKASPYLENVLSEKLGLSQIDETVKEYGTISYTIKDDAEFSDDTAKLVRNVPLAVARLQKVIIEAVLTGHLSINQDKWKVLVKEHDVPCAAIAFADLEQLFNHLVHATKDFETLKFPEVELTIINSEYQSSVLHLGNDVFASANSMIRNQEYDMVIDFSINETSKPLDVEFSEFKAKNNCYFNVRSSEVVYSERYIYTTDRIVYKPLTKLNPRGTHDNIEENVSHLRYFIQLLFRKVDFREGQLPIISRALQLKSVIGLLPTGGGKSLTYQISALLQPGVSIVVDPLMSLMKDQYDGLIKNGIDICTFINSTVQDKAKRENMMKDSKVLFVFMSPERLAIYRFRDSLRAMADNHVYFAYGIIDEVHCVSEWGHDFRFTYLHLGRNMYKYVLPKQTKDDSLYHITLIGLTATASFDVLADVERELSGNNAFPLDPEATVRYENTNRLELQYRIYKVHDDDAHDKWDVYTVKNETVPHIVSSLFYNSLQELLKEENIKQIKKRFIERENINVESKQARSIMEHDLSVDVNPDWYAHSDDVSSAIVFCPHRAGTMGVHTGSRLGIAGQIRQTLDIEKVSEFVGGDDPTTQDEFIQGETNLMVATKAFGMGIDKPHVRFTLNINHSGSLEAFVQEAGRAGRDKRMALAVVLYSDRVFQEIDPFTGKKEPVAVDYGVHKFFYDGNFLGENTEYMVMKYLMEYQETTVQEIDKLTRINKTVTGFLKKLNEANVGEAVVSYISYKYPSRDSKTLDGFLLQAAARDPKAGYRPISQKPQSPNENIKKLEEKNREQYEKSLMKAIYRMCCIGLIEDFTQDYINKELRIVTRKKPEGSYYEGLKEFFKRYYNEERAERQIEYCKSKYNGSEIENCLYFLTQFIYKKIATKRKQAIKDIEQFCRDATQSDSDWLATNEDLKDFLYYYFNSKYARSQYTDENGKPFSLVDDTDSGKNSYFKDDESKGSNFNASILKKYMSVVTSDGTSSPKDNIKHLQGAVRLIRRGILSINPTLSLLNVFCLLFLRADEASASLKEELESSYLDGYFHFRNMMPGEHFQKLIADYLHELISLRVTDEAHINQLELLGLMVEASEHSKWAQSFAQSFTKK